MKIHTTQNLSSLAQQQPTINVSSKEFRLSHNITNLKDEPDTVVVSHPSFKAAKPPVDGKKAKKIVNAAKKVVGEMKQEAAPDKRRGDDFLNSKAFDTMLKWAENEPVVQAAMAALICIFLRPLTIMALPNKKGKQDNMYASAHSISSGVMGLVSSILIAQPFKNGASYVMKNMYKDLDVKALERLNPHLNLESIWADKAKGIRKPVEEWLDIHGNKFSTELKDVAKIAKFKSLDEISAESYKYFGADVDWAAQKGKSFNEVVTKDGRSLYDALDWERLGIKVSDLGVDKKKDNGAASILLKNLDKEFLENLVKDAPAESNWSKLDVASVYGKDGLVKDLREWKSVDGKQWKLDLDSSFISSKFSTYQKNGAEGKLGTEIDQAMVDAGETNDVHTRLLTWAPDIVFRPFISIGTIALIPWVLKNVFHLEKAKKPQPQETAKAQTVVENKTTETTTKTEKVAFKAAPKPPKKPGLITRFLAKIYGKPLYESEKINKMSEKLNKVPGSITEHMATLGAMITSGVYVQQTLNKKELDKDRRRTLAINQVLCFIIPTICAYTVNNMLTNFKKKIEYRYCGLQEQKIAKAKMKGETIEGMEKALGTKLKGVRVLASLATFTLIYRYVTPVLITPIANWIGDKVNAKKAQKETQKA